MCLLAATTYIVDAHAVRRTIPDRLITLPPPRSLLDHSPTSWTRPKERAAHQRGRLVGACCTAHRCTLPCGCISDHARLGDPSTCLSSRILVNIHRPVQIRSRHGSAGQHISSDAELAQRHVALLITFFPFPQTLLRGQRYLHAYRRHLLICPPNLPITSAGRTPSFKAQPYEDHPQPALPLVTGLVSQQYGSSRPVEEP